MTEEGGANNIKHSKESNQGLKREKKEEGRVANWMRREKTTSMMRWKERRTKNA